MKRRIVKGDQCLNCGQALSDENFCPTCGQLNNTAKPTFGQLISDALANLFAWDSKFYLSIWPLMVKPGFLSSQIVNGKKNSYLPPIRLFVLMVVVSLLVHSLTNRAGRRWDDIDHLRKKKTEGIVNFTNDSTALDSLSSDIVIDNGDLKFNRSSRGYKFYRTFQYVANHLDTPIGEGMKELELENTFFNHLFYASCLKVNFMSNGELGAFMVSNLLIILLLFIPILALILKLLYFYKKEYFFVDHFVFAVHQQTALFVLITIYFLLEPVVGRSWPFLILFVFLFPTHLFLALKNFYRQRKTITALNFLLINVAFFAVGGIFIFLVAIVSFILI